MLESIGEAGIFLAVCAIVVLIAITAQAFLDKPKSRQAAEKIADKADAMRLAHEAKEDKWIAELEEQIDILKKNLIILREAPDVTIPNMESRKMAINSIYTAECTLAILYSRKGQRYTAATLYERIM